MLLATLAYGVIAFTVIRAPFQYDPLGPESWPRILSIVAALCLIAILRRPEVDDLGMTGRTGLRLLATLALLFGYAELYEPLGFILSTALFGGAMSAMMGARLPGAALFGIGAGLAGYAICAMLLGLNLPEGDLIGALGDALAAAPADGAA